MRCKISYDEIHKVTEVYMKYYQYMIWSFNYLIWILSDENMKHFDAFCFTNIIFNKAVLHSVPYVVKIHLFPKHHSRFTACVL
jgi:hypothetical protein